MKRLIALLVTTILGLTVAAQAQRFGGTTSSGFSNSPTNTSPGIPPSVTSVRPGNHSPGIPPSVTSVRPGWGFAPSNNFHHHHHRFNDNNVIPVFVPVYSYPYYGVGDYLLTNEDDYIPSYARPQPYDQSSYQQPVAQPQAPGPTVMEQGYQPQPMQTETASATPPSPPAVSSQPSQASEEPAEPEPGTVLVFKDGHVMQIGNYVIVGNTLYNLSGEYRQYKIALADIDLDATVKANEDRGIEFHLPKNPA